MFVLLLDQYQTWFNIFNFNNNHIHIDHNSTACNNNIKN